MSARHPFVLLLVLALLGCMSSRLNAQAIQLMPEPISIENIDAWSSQLGLEEAQRVAIEPVHDGYMEAFRELRDGPMASFSHEFRLMENEPIDDPERKVRLTISEIASLHRSAANLDEQFFSNIEALLSEEQIEHLTWVKLARDRSRIRQALGLEHDYGFGNKVVDIRAELCKRIEEGKKIRALDRLLASYQQSLSMQMKELAAAMLTQRVESTVRFAEHKAAAGGDMRKMDWQTYQESLAVFQKNERDVRRRVGQLNTQTLATIRPELDERVYWSIVDVVRRRSDPTVARHVYGPWRFWTKTLDDTAIDASIIEQIEVIALQNTAAWEQFFITAANHNRRAAEKSADATQEEAAEISAKLKDQLADARASNHASIEQAINAVRALLGDEPIEHLEARMNNLLQRSNRSNGRVLPMGDFAGEADLFVASTAIAVDGGDEAVSVVFSTDDESSAGGFVAIEGDALMSTNEALPMLISFEDAGGDGEMGIVHIVAHAASAAPARAMSAEEFDAYERMLGVDDDMAEITQTMYQDYIEQYREEVLPLVNESRDGTASWFEFVDGNIVQNDKESKATIQQVDAAVSQSDEELFEQLSVLLGTDEDSKPMKRATMSRARVRADARGKSNHFWSPSGTKEQEQDLIRLLYRGDFDQTDYQSVDTVLSTYEQTMTDLRQNRASTRQALNDLRNKISAMRKDGKTPSDMQVRTQQTHKDSIKSTEQQMATLNETTVASLCENLSYESSLRLDDLYIQRAFPRTYYTRSTDGINVAKVLRKVQQLQDQLADHADALSELQSSFSIRDAELEQAMLKLARAVAAGPTVQDENSHQIFASYHERMETLSFDRRELHLATIAKLRRMLDASQLKTVGLPVSD